MGFREPVRRSTLADANETRDWRIYAEFAHRLIAQARKLYADENLGLELTNTVYALDSTTIDLCLSLLPWAHFRKQHLRIKQFYGTSDKRGEDANLDRGFRLRPGCHRQEAPRLGSLPLHFAPDFLRHPLRENADAPGTFRNGDPHSRNTKSASN
jgi:hypothetical protein